MYESTGFEVLSLQDADCILVRQGTFVDLLVFVLQSSSDMQRLTVPRQGRVGSKVELEVWRDGDVQTLQQASSLQQPPCKCCTDWELFELCAAGVATRSTFGSEAALVLLKRVDFALRTCQGTV